MGLTNKLSRHYPPWRWIKPWGTWGRTFAHSGQWVGLRENLNRKETRFSHKLWDFPVIFPNKTNQLIRWLEKTSSVLSYGPMGLNLRRGEIPIFGDEDTILRWSSYSKLQRWNQIWQLQSALKRWSNFESASNKFFFGANLRYFFMLNFSGMFQRPLHHGQLGTDDLT